MKNCHLCVIESRWWDRSNTSVRGIFDLLSDLRTGSPHGYDYEMANSRAAFTESITRNMKKESCNYLYIASHGDANELSLYNDENVTRAVLRNALKKDHGDRNLCGLYFGSCSFVNQDTANFFYEENITPWWIAGYSKKIDWISSTALDFMVFNKLLSGGDQALDNPVPHIKKVARQLNQECAGLMKKLGFQIYLCEPQQNPIPLVLQNTP
jgi:hypothetical protein